MKIFSAILFAVLAASTIPRGVQAGTRNLGWGEDDGDDKTKYYKNKSSNYKGSSSSKKSSSMDTCGDCCSTVPIFLDIYHKQIDAIVEAAKICGPADIIKHSELEQEEVTDESRRKFMFILHILMLKYPCITVYNSQLSAIQQTTADAIEMVTELTGCPPPEKLLYKMRHDSMLLDRLLAEENE